MQLPSSEHLEIRYLSRIFDNKSECYKLFFMLAIVNNLDKNKNILTYEELINDMIAEAWYMVSEYRLNLGPSDTLEALVHRVYEVSGIKSSEKKAKILAYLEGCDDRGILNMKKTLTYFVPYRLQAPFLSNVKGKLWDGPKKELAARINQEQRLMYYFQEINGIQSRIEVQEDWCEYILKNKEIIKGWIHYNMIIYLQRRNPGVPGIANKLYPPQDRKLEHVKKLWKAVVEINPVKEIYCGELLESRDISIDHFVPWSYVSHDELWNLTPTTRTINSRKNNFLPEWDKYFPRLCENEYLVCSLVWENEKVHELFEKCSKEHINDEEVRQRLYRRGIDRREFEAGLEKTLYPAYQAAEQRGFRRWDR